MIPETHIDPMIHGPSGLRTFLNIAELWELHTEEQMVLLGIEDLATFSELTIRARAKDPVTVPMAMLERIGCVLSIYGSLVTLFPDGRTGYWLRLPNTNSTFGGKSALAKMTEGDLDDLRTVVRYLLAEIYGR